MPRVAPTRPSPFSRRPALSRWLAIVPLSLSAFLIHAPSHAASADGQASALILPALTTAVTDGLEFGAIAPSQTAASTVKVGVAGANDSTCGAGLTCPQSGDRAALVVTGAPNFRVSVTGPSATVLSDGQGNSMTVDGFNIGADGGGAASAFRLDTLGLATLYVGATLHVGANQPAGAYSGTFTVTASYE